jgi:hypothetical protein
MALIFVQSVMVNVTLWKECLSLISLLLALIVLGFFFAATAITGCCGGICRLTQFLTFYIGAVILNTVLLVLVGFYAIFKAVERKNAWAGMSLNNWNSLDNTTKDFVQQAVSRCYQGGHLVNTLRLDRLLFVEL